MSATIEDIRNLLTANKFQPDMCDKVAEGVLASTDGESIVYSFHSGWDIIKAHLCDRRWGAFNMELLSFVHENYKDDIERRTIIDGLQLEDHHWDWLKKSAVLKSDEYKWFFIFAEGLPQAACVIFHPKKSALEEGNIFYIEYVAVAPWNRPNPLKAPFLKGTGTKIIQHACDYAKENLGLRPGFCLHALPKATGFYEKIGMLAHPQLDKDRLPYYEMPLQAASNFLGQR